MRASCGWSDASILNVSSRGLQIHTTRAAVRGTLVEIWHGEHLIIARVVWRKGTRAGLMAEQTVPVEDLVTLSHLPQHMLIAPSWPQVDRRRGPRALDDDGLRPRFIEFAGVLLIASSLALGAFAMLQAVFSGTIANVKAALGG